MEVVASLDKILFDDYVKRKSDDMAKIIKKGILGGNTDWADAPKPVGTLGCRLIRYQQS